MSKGQHAQANQHGKRGTRGERKLSKLGIITKPSNLKALAKKLGVPYTKRSG